MRMPININNVPNEYIMRTKAGNLWRCGKGYRKNWAKLIGKLVLLHNTPYTLINRIKKAGKWYLIFTDGNNNYTPQEIYNMVEEIKVYPERYLTINIRINNILFEDDTKYYF